MTDQLRRLSTAAGIEAAYWDGLGVRRDLTEASTRALLRALDLDPQDDLPGQTAALEDASWLRTLPPVVLLTADEKVEFDLTLPAAETNETQGWQVVLESGESVWGAAVPQTLGLSRTVAGELKQRCRLALGIALPAGYHRVHLARQHSQCALIASPKRCHIPEFLAAGGRCWGLAIQLYALRSARNWGMGDFSDLAVIARIAGHAGAALIGLNPLHARHLARTEEASPYSPSSRLMLDPLYIDVAAVTEYADCLQAQAHTQSAAFQTRLAAARDTQLVDYQAVSDLKLPVLKILYLRFRKRDPSDPRVVAFRDFVRNAGQALEHFATFEALRFFILEREGHLPGWRDWPADLRNPDSDAVLAFRTEQAEEIGFHQYLQWLAESQLTSAATAARECGMQIGLYRDLAVGAADDGAECWSGQSLFCPSASVGAPPDLLNREGQDWGLPPWKPGALETAAYTPMVDLLAANMRSAGALRMDHVMSLSRLFWIPSGTSGAQGGYVRNAFDILTGIVALESIRNACMVVGEDLGSVPDGLRESLADCGFLSYRVLKFERHWYADGSFIHPDEYPAQSLATAVTHDMPPIAEYWSGDDVDRRAALGLFPEPQLRDAEVAQREHERLAMLELLARIGRSPSNRNDTEQISAALHAAVGMTRAMLAVVQLDDVVGEVLPINIPGTHHEYPNWRRKVARPIEELATDVRWTTLARTMREVGRSAR